MSDPWLSCVVASDPSALIEHTRNVVYLEDEDGTADPRRYLDAVLARLRKLEIYTFANCADSMRQVVRRGRRALQDTLTAIRLGVPVGQAGRALYPNGERHLRPLASLKAIYPPSLLEASLEIAGCCRFDLGELRYEYPAELVPEGHTPASWLRELTEQGIRRRWPGGADDGVRAAIEHELALIRDLSYEPFFLTVQDIVSFARRRGILGPRSRSGLVLRNGYQPHAPDPRGSQPVGELQEEARRRDVLGEECVPSSGAAEHLDGRGLHRRVCLSPGAVSGRSAAGGGLCFCFFLGRAGFRFGPSMRDSGHRCSCEKNGQGGRKPCPDPVRDPPGARSLPRARVPFRDPGFRRPAPPRRERLGSMCCRPSVLLVCSSGC